MKKLDSMLVKKNNGGELESDTSSDESKNSSEMSKPENYYQYLSVFPNNNEKKITFRVKFLNLLEESDKLMKKRISSKHGKAFLSLNAPSEWDQILFGENSLNSNENSQIESIKKKVSEEFDDISFFKKKEEITNELRYISEKEVENRKVLKKVEKKIQKIRRLRNSPSFYTCLSFCYFQYLLTRNKPFTLFLEFLKALKNKTLQIFNPFSSNLKNSLSVYDEAIKKYFFNKLIELAKEMLSEYEKNSNKYSKFQSEITNLLEKFMETEKLFLIMCISAIKTLIFDKCIDKNIDKKTENRLLDEKNEINMSDISLIADFFDVQIKIYGYEVSKKSKKFEFINESFGENEDFSILLYYSDGIYNLGYKKDD